MLDDLNYIAQFDNSNALAVAGGLAESSKESVWLGPRIGLFKLAVPELDNPAKQLAKQLVGHRVQVKSDDHFRGVAVEWNTKFNQWRVLKWASTKTIAITSGRSDVESETVNIVVVMPKGTMQQQAIWLEVLGQFVFVYLAILNQTDPSAPKFQLNAIK